MGVAAVDVVDGLGPIVVGAVLAGIVAVEATRELGEGTTVSLITDMDDVVPTVPGAAVVGLPVVMTASELGKATTVAEPAEPDRLG